MLLINKTLLRLSKGLWGWIVLIACLKMGSLIGLTAFAQVVSGFLGTLDSPQMTVGQAQSAVLAAFCAAVAAFAFDLLTGEAEYRCTAKARVLLRAGIFEKVLSLDSASMEKLGAVRAITSSVDGVESMQVYYSKYLPGLLYSIMAPVYLFFRIRSVSLWAAVVLFVISISLLPLNNFFRSKIEELKTDYWASMEDLTGCYLESVRGLTTLKLFGQDENRTQLLKKKSEHFNAKIMDVMKVNFASFLMTDGLIYASVVLAAAVACQQIVSGAVSFSDGLMVLMMSYGFFGAIRQLMNATHSALGGVAAADRVEELLKMDSVLSVDKKIPVQKDAYNGISMKDISYSYEGRHAALKQVSLNIPKGKVTALVGLSGCGKSTAAALLMRFFDPKSGSIIIEGHDYKSLSPDELRKKIIMVPQTVSLFSQTLEDNLRMAAPNATEEQLWEALKDVRLDDWAHALPDGLKTQLGDAGAKLSGGQRQKIGIARALLCKAEYIIFDEATSSVDVESEQEIWACIHRLAQTRTLILISHRLSTVAQADCIYVLSGGRVAEKGTHMELMKQNGLYRRLTVEQAQLEESALAGDRTEAYHE